MNRKDLSFLEEMFQKKVDHINDAVLIINQSLENVLYSSHENIRVINSKEFGLSKSRNLAIKNASKQLCWILDDDCVVLPDAVETIVSAYNQVPASVITFQTEKIETGEKYWNYPQNKQPHTDQTHAQVLSPEITFRKQIVGTTLWFDERFGLGAQFEDSENYIFLRESLLHDISTYFMDKTIVKHASCNSSDDPIADRVIYARGALAAYLNHNITFRKWKYGFFLLRKGMILNPKETLRKVKLFKQGATDFKKSSEI